MATDRNGKTVVVGTDYVVAAPCKAVSGGDVVLGTGKRAVTVEAGDIVRVAQLADPRVVQIAWDHLEDGANGTTQTSGAGGGGATNSGSRAWMQTADTYGIAFAWNGTGTTSSDAGLRYGGTFAGNTRAYLADGSRFYFRVSANSVATCLYRFGLTTSAHGATSDVANGVYFELDTGTSANLYGATAASSIRTKTDTSIAGSVIDSAWRWFGIEFVNGTTGARFYDLGAADWPTLIEDATAALTIATNLPTAGANRDCNWFVQSIGNGDASKLLFVDAFGVEIDA